MEEARVVKQEQLLDEDSWLLESAKEEEEEGKGMARGGAKAEKMDFEEEEEEDADDVEEEPCEDQGEQSKKAIFFTKSCLKYKSKGRNK